MIWGWIGSASATVGHMVVVALMVKRISNGLVLYWSERVAMSNGLGQQTFWMPKFRTMRVDTPVVATHLLSDPDVYLSPVGGFLRRSSLDELPVPDKVALDVEYLRRCSFWFDIKIFKKPLSGI